MLCFLPHITSSDSALGRIHPDSLEQQDLMELLVEGIVEKHHFKENGDYMAISRWRSVEQDGCGHVTGIGWFQYSGVCFFVGGTMDLSYLPPTVLNFDSPGQHLMGTIATRRLPVALVSIDVSNNHYSGRLALAELPAEMRIADFSHNLFTGNVDLTRLPAKIEGLSIKGNFFTGSVDFRKLPQSLVDIDISSNKLSGTIADFRMPDALAFFRICKNRLTGNVEISHSARVDRVLSYLANDDLRVELKILR